MSQESSMKSLFGFLLLSGFSGLALADAAAPIPNKGDVAWMIVATVLVILMIKHCSHFMVFNPVNYSLADA